MPDRTAGTARFLWVLNGVKALSIRFVADAVSDNSPHSISMLQTWLLIPASIAGVTLIKTPRWSASTGFIALPA